MEAMCDSASSGFYSETGSSSRSGSVRTSRSRPRPPSVSEADTKRKDIDLKLQMIIARIERELKKAKSSPAAANGAMLLIDKGVSQMNKVMDELRTATSSLITQIEENGGSWVEEWPESSPESLERWILERATEVDEMEEKVICVVQSSTAEPTVTTENENIPPPRVSLGGQTFATSGQPTRPRCQKWISKWLQRIKSPKAEIQNQKFVEVKQFLEDPKAQDFFKTREDQDQMKVKQRGEEVKQREPNLGEESGIGQSTIHLVTQRLGERSFTCILDYARSGKISEDAIKDFAERLGRDNMRPNVLLGRHKTRMERNGLRNRKDEMQDILGDWWTHHRLHQIPQGTAIQQLVEIFEEIDGCKPLAFKLKGALER